MSTPLGTRAPHPAAMRLRAAAASGASQRNEEALVAIEHLGVVRDDRDHLARNGLQVVDHAVGVGPQRARESPEDLVRLLLVSGGVDAAGVARSIPTLSA